MEKEIILKSAELSVCENYRYSLFRLWNNDQDRILFIGLNPSTADASKDDATTRRLKSFAEDMGFGGYHLCNLFAFRATKPADLFKEKFPVSEPGDPDANNQWILKIAKYCSKVVFCWGNDGVADQRCYEVQKMFPDAYCFGLTMNGQPKHPLYLPASTPLVKFAEDKSFIHKKQF